MLITLVIIGVIAALTIPNLMQKYQDEVLKTAYKKTYNILNNAYRTVIAENGPLDCYYTYGNVPITKDCQTLFNNMFSNTLKTAKKCENNALQNGCLPDNGYKSAQNVERENGMPEEDANNSHGGCWMVRSNYINNILGAFILNDGQIVIFYPISPYPYMFVDINGKKGPNKWGYDIFEFDIGQQYLNNGRIAPQLIIPGRTSCTLVEKGGRTPWEMYNYSILNK